MNFPLETAARSCKTNLIGLGIRLQRTMQHKANLAQGRRCRLRVPPRRTRSPRRLRVRRQT